MRIGVSEKLFNNNLVRIWTNCWSEAARSSPPELPILTGMSLKRFLSIEKSDIIRKAAEAPERHTCKNGHDIHLWTRSAA